jgi:hypothetical protein
MSAHQNVILIWGPPAPPTDELFIFAPQPHAEVQEPLFAMESAALGTLYCSEEVHTFLVLLQSSIAFENSTTRNELVFWGDCL